MKGSMAGGSAKELWDEALSIIQQRVPKPSFDAWFRPLTLEGVEDGRVRVMIPNRFFKEWFEDHYAGLLKSTLEDLLFTKVEVSLRLPDSEAAEFMSSYGLTELGTKRVIRATSEVLGQMVFFTVGEKECRAWNIPRGATALQAAGAIHSDLEKHFIRAEVVAWDKLLETGGLAEARQTGVLRLEGKDYVAQDGEIIHIRHSG